MSIPKKDDPAAEQGGQPGTRSGEGSRSLHEPMQRDRDQKNQDETDRKLIGKDDAPPPPPPGVE